jgi:hypothetical protein
VKAWAKNCCFYYRRLFHSFIYFIFWFFGEPRLYQSQFPLFFENHGYMCVCVCVCLRACSFDFLNHGYISEPALLIIWEAWVHITQTSPIDIWEPWIPKLNNCPQKHAILADDMLLFVFIRSEIYLQRKVVCLFCFFEISQSTVPSTTLFLGFVFLSGMLWASMLHQLCCQIWKSLWPCSSVSSRFFMLLADNFCLHILTSPWPLLYK